MTASNTSTVQTGDSRKRTMKAKLSDHYPSPFAFLGG
jgi:hypothetical protein